MTQLSTSTPTHENAVSDAHGILARDRSQLLSRKQIYWILGIAIALWFCLAPFLTIFQIKRAVRNNDGEALAELINYSALKSSIKTNINNQMSGQLNHTLSNPLSGVGNALLNAMLNRLVDGVNTPMGLATALRSTNLKIIPNGDTFVFTGYAQPSTEESGGLSLPAISGFGYQDLNHFSVTLQAQDAKSDLASLILYRDGLFNWRLSGVHLSPPDPLMAGKDTNTNSIGSTVVVPTDGVEVLKSVPVEGIAPIGEMAATVGSDFVAPSFDCTNATAHLDRLVCANADLAGLDNNIAVTYAAALAKTGNKASLSAAQSAWQQNVRNACTSANCLRSVSERRIIELTALAQPADLAPKLPSGSTSTSTSTSTNTDAPVKAPSTPVPAVLGQ